VPVRNSVDMAGVCVWPRRRTHHRASCALSGQYLPQPRTRTHAACQSRNGRSGCRSRHGGLAIASRSVRRRFVALSLALTVGVYEA
jgi:hypothetical protein